MSPLIRQRESSLQHANWVRSKRAHMKADLRAGKRRLREAVLACPDYMRTARVADVLKVLPGFGPYKLRRIGSYCGIELSVPIGSLPLAHRADLTVVSEEVLQDGLAALS